MSNPFFEHPILNSPYECPQRYWELDDEGQPTQQTIERRRPAKFITPIPKPRKRKAAAKQEEMVFDEGKGLSTKDQQYDPTSSIINQLRQYVDQWRSVPNPNHWQVTPETARLLQHWRHHTFNSIRPFFCQVEAIETVIWLTEVAPKLAAADMKGTLDKAGITNQDQVLRQAPVGAAGSCAYASKREYPRDRKELPPSKIDCGRGRRAPLDRQHGGSDVTGVLRAEWYCDFRAGRLA